MLPMRPAAAPLVKVLALTAAALALIAVSCGTGDEPVPLAADLGGDTTRDDATSNAFELPAPGLTNSERREFERGDSFFTQNWVTAPASTDARDGLGPTFNAQSCSSCHLHDGRGLLPTEDQAGRLGLLLRVSIPGEDPVTGAPLPHPAYGGQLQDRSILEVPAEGLIDIEYEEIQGTYGDGTPYTLLDPTYSITDERFGPTDELLLGPRLAPQVIGVGLLEEIPERDIRDAADPDDEDGDGISGRVNEVWDQRTESPSLGRFGWKANVATVEQQVAGAFLGDIGITSSLNPEENCPDPQTDCSAALNGGSPEVTDSRLAAVTFYQRTLAVPAMRGADDPDVIEGAELFEEFGCSGCHTPTQRTGDSDVETLADQTLHPYTDLLLHDMGEPLSDNRPDFAASGSEWRTPPLWGLGLIEVVNGERFLLHDGRARTPAEAILWHGGEAEASKERFRDASAPQRESLIEFLEAL